MSVSNRAILRLALPALGVLAAEPLYVLVDTAVVGHLGRTQLGGLAVASTLLTTLLWLTNFLEYGTTGVVARLVGAGRADDALDAGVQATWLAIASGALVMLVAEVVCDPALRLVAGGDAAVHEQAVTWIRIAALGAPFVCVTLAGQGWLRGVQDTLTPLLVVVAGNVVSAGLSVALVYGLHMGIRGSALTNAVAQTGSAAVFAVALARRRRGHSWRPLWAVMRPQLDAALHFGVRTVAFLVAFSTATAVAARMGASVVGGHQIAIQLWSFLALALDALAIAAQAMVGAAVGAGDTRGAQALAMRLCWWGLAAGSLFCVLLLAGWSVLPRLFTGDPAVIDAAHAAWPWFAGMEPAAGVVFALDGVFFGAGDVRFVRTVTVVAAAIYVPMAIIALRAGLGLGGVWLGLTLFISVRLVAGLARLRAGAWWAAGLAPLR